jgi:hypothetical protein
MQSTPVADRLTGLERLTYNLRILDEVLVVITQKMTLGPAPDFVIHKGKILCYHRISVTVDVYGNRAYKRSIANQSMLMAICELKQILSVIDIVQDTAVQWRKHLGLRGDVTSPRGTASFFYRLLETTPKEFVDMLHDGFRQLFTENL